MRLKQLQRGGFLILALGLSACGSNGGTTAVSGRVIQGPVQNAVIFADRLSAGTRFVKDSDEVSTTTGPTGNFTLSVPSGYGDYVLVSQGGLDSLTGKAAMQMIAPAGAANVTPLTTLVVLAPASQQASLKALILSTGTSFDADISASATPAALLLTKSIEASIQTLSKSIDPTGTKLTSSELYDVQQKALSSIAASVASQTTLLTTVALKDAISTGITNAIPTIIAGNAAIKVNPTDIATIAAVVSNTVTSVATSMGNPAGNYPTNTTITEAAQFPAATQNIIDTAVTDNSAIAGAVVTVVPAAPTVLLTSSSLTGIAITSPVTVVFSRAMNPTTISATTFKVNGVTGTVSYNGATNTATFTPSAILAYDTTYTVMLTNGITDTAGITLVPAVLTFRTVVRPLSGSTGTSGTGANF